jgi:hypothetical protein
LLAVAFLSSSLIYLECYNIWNLMSLCTFLGAHNWPGSRHSVVLTNEHRVFGFGGLSVSSFCIFFLLFLSLFLFIDSGYSAFGQLGKNATSAATFSPVEITTTDDVRSVSAGGFATLLTMSIT